MIAFPAGKTLREPRPLRERPNRLSIDMSNRHPGDITERKRLILQALRSAFRGRKPAVLHWTAQPLYVPHSQDTAGNCRESCVQCDLQRRAEAGKPVMQYVMDIEVNHPSRLIVSAKRHTNPRQQKKWAKLGVVVERPEREVQKWVLTPMQFTALREVWKQLRK